MENLLADSFERLLAQVSSPAAVRTVEEGGDPAALWAPIEASGFLDVLVPEERGGAGLGLADAFPLFMSAGRHALPLPFAHTVLARVCLASAGQDIPEGPITLLPSDGLLWEAATFSALVPYGASADWVLTTMEDRSVLLPVAAATREGATARGGIRHLLVWNALPLESIISGPAQADIAAVSAAAHAALIAGAADRVVSMTLDYAGQRTQFGKPIGKFQAIQSQLAVMAERALVARIAAGMACQSSNWIPQPLLAAVGKGRASEAAAIVADISHAVHGAIGITEEYDLQLYTRRLREWRLSGGAEAHWDHQVGEALLASETSALSFLCSDLFPAARDC